MFGRRHSTCPRIGPILALAVAVGVIGPARADVTGAQVKRATRAGVRALRARQLPDGAWPEHSQPGGATCLATLALLQAGEQPDTPRMSAALAHIRKLPNQYVYVTSLKAMVLAQAGRAEDRLVLREAANWLASAQNRTGLWNYTPGGDRFDHSNSQFALLGLHAAASAGAKIQNTVWQRAQAQILKTQLQDGGWSYQAAGESYGSMTAAGVADLLVLGTRLHQGEERGFTRGAAPNCGRYRTSQPLARGLAWLGRNFRASQNPRRGPAWVHYWLYAVERCGILSGRRYFGPHDWYREGAAYLVQSQAPDGLWNSSIVDTAFAVLFLAKGHASLLVQKLQWSADDAWNPDRHDLAHLVSFIDDQLGRPIAWQVVAFDAPLEDWLAAPLLYFQGHTFPEWNAQQRAKLRKYIEHGGTILAEACCGRADFRTGFTRFVAETFPEAPLRALGPDHAVYHLLHKLEPRPREGDDAAELLGLDLGCRTAVFFSPRDLSCLWEQARIPNLSERAFRLGTNIAAYAAGRRPLRDRLDVVVLPAERPQESTPPAHDALRLAQVVYEGDWRPFPNALVRLAEFLRDEANLDVVPEYRQVRLTDPDLYASPILFLAGHFDFELGAAERQALADHLRRGGFLVADACCGTEPFDTALHRLLKQAFPASALEKLPADHPLFAGAPGFKMTTVDYSPDVARAHPELDTPELWGLAIDGRLAVVYSPYSLSCGLSGPAFDGCWGLASDDARRLAANIVLYALTH